MIPVKNAYYMLTYVFKLLSEKGYKDIATEKFENTAELFSAILAKGIAVQLKRGINKAYIDVNETLSVVRGKIDVTGSLQTMRNSNAQLVCSYDEFCENSYLNRILKTTVMVLLRANMSNARKHELRKLMMYFDNVDILDIRTIDWRIQYNRNNNSYHLLLSICNLVIKGLLHTQSDGSQKLMDFLDERSESKLYEKFILEYYRKHFQSLSVNSEQIVWQLDGGSNDRLPVMQTDIMLKDGNKVLIIDAKYYTHTMQTRFDAHTVHSANLYQIFTYVKNKECELKDKKHCVAGMLLYAKTDEIDQPNYTYNMSGNRIDVRTLDLNCKFPFICNQLNKIAEDFFDQARS